MPHGRVAAAVRSGRGLLEPDFGVARTAGLASAHTGDAVARDNKGHSAGESGSGARTDCFHTGTDGSAPRRTRSAPHAARSPFPSLAAAKGRSGGTPGSAGQEVTTGVAGG